MTLRKKQKKLIFKIILGIGILFLTVFLCFIYAFFAPNIFVKTTQNAYLYIYPQSDLKTVIGSIESKAVIKNKMTFEQVARILKYENHTRSGKYKIQNSVSNYKFIKRLRNKEQTPVKVTFNNIRTKEQLAGYLASKLMPDSLSIINLMNDRYFLNSYGLTPEIAIVFFIPNTYEFFWDIQPEKIFKRMENEYEKFWTEERRKRAEVISLSPTEVSILASIVEEETNMNSEKPVVAGLYLNRLHIRMPLQADPTVKFAVGDFSLQRILKKHLEVDSPYNTYRYAGLPPGPIRTPSAKSIDAVLNYEKHNYIYMCAKETLNGEHNFAASWNDHLENARKYQQALNKREIYR